MLKAIQCSTSAEPLFSATSGSCMMSEKLMVPAGTLSQLRAGDTGAVLAWVYLSGMTPPSAKAELVRTMGVGGEAAGAGCANAGPVAKMIAPRIVAERSRICPPCQPRPRHPRVGKRSSFDQRTAHIKGAGHDTWHRRHPGHRKRATTGPAYPRCPDWTGGRGLCPRRRGQAATPETKLGTQFV